MTDNTTQGVAKKMWDDLGFPSEESVSAEEATFDMIPRAEADARVAAVIDWYDGLVGSSTGVAGYHVNGAVAGWGEFDRPTCPDDARAALEAMLAEAEKRGEKRGKLRAAEIAWARVEGNSERDREAAEISMAIRAEAGD